MNALFALVLATTPQHIHAEFTQVSFMLSAGTSRTVAEERAIKTNQWTSLWSTWRFSTRIPSYYGAFPDIEGEPDTTIPSYDWWSNAAKPNWMDSSNPRPELNVSNWFVRSTNAEPGESYFAIFRVARESYLWYEMGSTRTAGLRATEERFAKDKAPWMVLLQFKTGHDVRYSTSSPRRP
jgi:hypothetical protein